MKKITLSATVLSATALLAACGSGDGGTSSTDSTTSAAETSSADSSAPAGTGGELTIWVDENREPAVEAAAEAFEAATGSTVTLVQKNFEDIRNDFLAQVPTGEGPDITVGAHDWLGAFIVNGVVDSVDLAEKSGEFSEVSLSAFSSDGQLYGLPYAVEAVALLRNTELAPDPAPATFDELVAAGEATGAKYPLVIKTGAEGDAYTYYAFQTSFGAPVFKQNADGTYTSELGMGEAGGQDYAAWLAENGEKGTKLFSSAMTLDIAEAEFMKGNAPYTIDGPWNVSKFADAGIDLAVDPIPAPGPETAAPFVGVQGFYVSAQSKNALVANDFLVNYMATPDAQRALFDADPRPPAMNAIAEEVADDPIMNGFLASAANGQPMPSIPEMGSVWEFWGVTEAKIISGATEPEAAWTKMTADINKAIGS